MVCLVFVQLTHLTRACVFVQREGVLPEELLREHVTRVSSILENGLQEAKGWQARADVHLSGSRWSGFVQPTDLTVSPPTGVQASSLVDVGVASVRLPAGAVPHPRLERLFMAARVQKLQKNEPLDWATCEAVRVPLVLVHVLTCARARSWRLARCCWRGSTCG